MESKLWKTHKKNVRVDAEADIYISSSSYGFGTTSKVFYAGLFFSVEYVTIGQIHWRRESKKPDFNW